VMMNSSEIVKRHLQYMLSMKPKTQLFRKLNVWIG